MIIAPSILSANFGNLEHDLKMLNESLADWVHIDVMDGVFVPNISFGTPIMKTIKQHSKKVLDVHLMITKPEAYIDTFTSLGADVLTLHIEASTHLHRSIQKIKENGMKVGVAINPHTPIGNLEEIIKDVDLICLMSVNPGFGGQKFIPNTFYKLKRLQKMISSSGSCTKIQIDGGVTLENAPLLKDEGADILVAGNTVFSSPNPKNTIATLKNT